MLVALACRDLSKNERIQWPWSVGIVTQSCAGDPTAQLHAAFLHGFWLKLWQSVLLCTELSSAHWVPLNFQSARGISPWAS